MKIQDDKNIRQAVKLPAQKTASLKNDDFKHILSEVQSKSGESGDNEPIRIDTLEKPHPPFQSNRALEKLEAGTFNAECTSAAGDKIKKVESLLDLLESYSLALSDPKKSLREVSPLVGRLEREQKQLEAWGKHLAEGDGFQDIVRQAVILSQVEVARFNRGDYLE